MFLVYAERAEVGIMGPRFDARDLDEAAALFEAAAENDLWPEGAEVIAEEVGTGRRWMLVDGWELL